MEGNATAFLCYQPNCQMGFTFTTTRCSLCSLYNSAHFNFLWQKKFEDNKLCSLWMQVCKGFFL